MRRPSLAARCVRASLAGCTLGPELPAARRAQGRAPTCPTSRPSSSPAALPAARRSASSQSLDIPGQWWARLPVAAAQQPDRDGAARQSRHPGRRRRAARWRRRTPARSAPPCFRPCRRASAPRRTRCRPCCRRRPPTTTTSTACSRLGLTLSYNARPVGRQPAADRIARCAGRGAVLPARGRLSVARLQRRRGGHPRGLAARPDRGDPAHHRRPARHARHPASASRAWARSPAPTSPPSRPRSPRPRRRCRRLQKALAQQRNLLATLTGRFPDQSLAERFKLADLKLPQELPLSLPSKLVEQRPDVRAAEANLHSARRSGRRRDRQPVPARSR